MNIWSAGVTLGLIAAALLADHYFLESLVLVSIGKYLMDITTWMAFWR